MKLLLVFLFSVQTIHSIGQDFANEDYNYRQDSTEYAKLHLKGDVKSVKVSVFSNLNYDKNTSIVKIDPEFEFCMIYVVQNDSLSEVISKSNDSTIYRKRLYSRGKISESISYLPEGVPDYRCLYTYNEFHRPKEIQVLNNAGNVVQLCKSEYDADRRLISVTNVAINENYRYIYDEFGGYYEVKYVTGKTGFAIETAHYHRKIGNTRFVYTVKANYTTPFDSIPLCEKLPLTENTFDLDGNEICSRLYNYLEGSVLIQTCNRTYSSGKLESEIILNGENLVEASRYFYKNGLLDRKVSENKYDQLTSTYKYDKAGNLQTELEVKNDGSRSEIKSVYVFDDHQNWTSRKLIIDEKVFSIATREIIYNAE